MMTIKEINTLIICGALLLIALFGVYGSYWQIK